jgi:glycosyltransferase involved in cell wall biosynthesis
MSELHVVVPEGVDDPARPSGGNAYDRRVCHGLATAGWDPRLHAVPGGWPSPGAAAHEALAGMVREIPDGAVVLIDGLIASTAPEVLVPQARRLRLVVLVHMPLGQGSADERTRAREGAVLTAAAAVVATSAWTRSTLMQLYALPGERVYVATPGVDAAALAPGTEAAGALLCVATVIPGKGQDVLLDALETIAGLPWHCRLVGSLDRDPAFAQALRRRITEARLDDRVSLTGALREAELDRSYAAADLFVLASRSETYGMVVTEALARGLPVVAAEVGGVPEALGCSAEGTAPGLLVPPDDPVALGAALRSWLGDADLRRRLQRAARDRRTALANWTATTAVVARVLSGTVAR